MKRIEYHNFVCVLLIIPVDIHCDLRDASHVTCTIRIPMRTRHL